MLYKDILNGVFDARMKQIIEHTNDLINYYINNFDITPERLCLTNNVKVLDIENENLNILCFLSYRDSYIITIVNNAKRDFYIYREFVMSIIDEYVRQFITVDNKILDSSIIDSVTKYDKNNSRLDKYLNGMANVLLEKDIATNNKKEIKNKNKRFIKIINEWCED